MNDEEKIKELLDLIERYKEVADSWRKLYFAEKKNNLVNIKNIIE